MARTTDFVAQWRDLPRNHLPFRPGTGHDGGMEPDYDHLQRAARDHLWMHFTRHSTYDHADVPIIVRGEGPYIWDTNSPASASR